MKTDQEKFINKYKYAAIIDGALTGVPPSITLAQAILESGWGKSTLATNGNNFFGIKKHDWTGKTIVLPTQEYVNGAYLDVNAEWRAYPNAFSSFNDHSKFLIDNTRYADLFSLDFKDYKGWSYGLKSAGYATSPTYAIKLINLIESYNLNRFDKRADVLNIGVSIAGVLAALSVLYIISI